MGGSWRSSLPGWGPQAFKGAKPCAAGARIGIGFGTARAHRACRDHSEASGGAGDQPARIMA
jgi:hypothetical protein